MVTKHDDPHREFAPAPAPTESVELKTCSPLIAFAGGGTGGHLYPALAIAASLRRRLPRARFVFFGTQRPIDERILTSEEHRQLEPDSEVPAFPLVAQTLPPLRPAPWRWPGIYRGYRKSTLLCRERFQTDRPAVVVGTGGLGSVPAVREAARMGIPTVLLNPDAIPGRANRYLAGSADVVFAQWDETTNHFPSSTRVVVCGCPIRAPFNRANRSSGLKRFGLDEDRRTLLVTGASQGARTVNEAVVANLPFLLTKDDWQILHLTGHTDYEEINEAYDRLRQSGDGKRLRATVLAFTEQMADALSAADLVVARAGASTLAEITAVGRASILIPYPHHRDQHQRANARCLVRASAARIVHDKVDSAVNGASLRVVLEQLMGDAATRESMAAAARRLGRGQAAAQIADYIAGLPGIPAAQPPLTFRMGDVRAEPTRGSPGVKDESLEASC